jgi:hypothetical protein
VRIAIFVGELVMDTVRRNPKHRPAFERQRPADREEILDPLGRLVRNDGSANGDTPFLCPSSKKSSKAPKR